MHAGAVVRQGRWGFPEEHPLDEYLWPGQPTENSAPISEPISCAAIRAFVQRALLVQSRNSETPKLRNTRGPRLWIGRFGLRGWIEALQGPPGLDAGGPGCP